MKCNGGGGGGEGGGRRLKSLSLLCSLLFNSPQVQNVYIHIIHVHYVHLNNKKDDRYFVILFLLGPMFPCYVLCSSVKRIQV